MVLALQNVSKHFERKAETVNAVVEATLSVSREEFVTVVGPSGCGKTTLLLMSGTLQRRSSGKVLINGTDPYQMDPEARCVFRAGKVGFVFQQFHLIPYLSVLENIMAPSLALRIANPREKADTLIERFGLSHRKDHVPAEWSTGERQRTALARALLHDPPLILADEPTGNLDENTGETVLSALKEFAAAGGAVLMVTHDPNAKNFATRSVEMKGGRILASPAS